MLGTHNASRRITIRARTAFKKTDLEHTGGYYPLIHALSTLQVISAILGTVTGAFTFSVAIRNLPRIRSYATLMLERNQAFNRIVGIELALKQAQASIEVNSRALESLRSLNNDAGVHADELKNRISSLEDERAINVALLGWLPRALEFISWIQEIASINNLDLGGRTMPALPEIVIEAEKKVRNAEP